MTARQTAQTLDRGLAIMEILANDENSLSISEIARRLDVHRTIAHRLVATLEQRRYVARAADNKYQLGSILLHVASRVGRELRTVARPFLIALNKEVDETIHLVVPAGTEVLFIDAYESSKSLRVTSRTGQSLPAHATSVGKAILATLPIEELEALYPSSTLPRIAPGTLSKRSELYAQLKVVRQSGYAVSSEESESGVGSIGVAIVGQNGVAQAALSIAAPTRRIAPEIIPRFALEAQKAAQKIGALI